MSLFRRSFGMLLGAQRPPTAPAPLLPMGSRFVTITRQYTYAQLVAAASGAAQLPFYPGVPGCLIIPIVIVTRMRRNAIAGTSTVISFRWSSSPATNLLGANPPFNFNSGGVDQTAVYLTGMAGTTLTFGTGVIPQGGALTVNNNSPTAATGCVGTADLTIGLAIVPVP